MVDTFTRTNNTFLGPNWLTTSVGNACTIANGGMAISSNTAYTTVSGGAGCFNVALAANADQFSQATVAAMDAANGVAVSARVSTTGAATFYKYNCLGTGGGQNLQKKVAGANTVLITSAVNCSVNDTIELRVIGSSLFGIRNGIVNLYFVDSAIASGAPGVTANEATSNALKNWTGGSVPLYDTNRSLFSLAQLAPAYGTLTNCAVNSVSPAACGSAAAGAFVIPTTTATYTVNTTAVTPYSVIILTPRTYTGDLPSAPTCVVPTITAEPVVSAIVAGTSFTMTETKQPDKLAGIITL